MGWGGRDILQNKLWDRFWQLGLALSPLSSSIKLSHNVSEFRVKKTAPLSRTHLKAEFSKKVRGVGNSKKTSLVRAEHLWTYSGSGWGIL